MVKDAIVLNNKLKSLEWEIGARDTAHKSRLSEAIKKIHEERKVINCQWRDNSSQNGELEHAVACVDTSGSMECDNGVPLYNAIGLGIRIAEKSTLGRRILTFSNTPRWVNLENKGSADNDFDFCDAVNKVKDVHDWGMTTNFHAMLDMILDACKQSSLPQEQVSKMMLIVLSDMQINSASTEFNNETMIEMMERKYNQAGYTLPHIVFWNLRTTNGFPVLSSKKNTTMMSGFSPVLLNEFMNKGLQALQEFTPWYQLVHILKNERYNCMEVKIRRILEDAHQNSLNDIAGPNVEADPNANANTNTNTKHEDPLSKLTNLSTHPVASPPPPPPSS